MTMAKPKILIQLDTDTQPSSFDAVVAVDSGCDQLLQYGGVTQDQVQGLVHGAMFTRGPQDLHQTAVFVGGSDVTLGEQIMSSVVDSFFGPIRVSVMMDASGANTTASAAVVAASRHLDLSTSKALVLAATGPVGQRVVRLLAGAGARVNVASRSTNRAQSVVERITSVTENAELAAFGISSEADLIRALEDVDLVVSAGAAGVELLPCNVRENSNLKVAIDLNAVPPVGITGIDIMDKAKQAGGQILYGAIGVGGTKMKIHQAAIVKLFSANDCVLDIDEIFKLGIEIEASS